MSKTKTIDMTQGKAFGNILRFAIPLICGSLFQQLYAAVDSIIVGRFVGANAFAATGATASLTMVFTSVLMGVAIGSGVVISQFFGAKNDEMTASSIANATYVNLAFCISSIFFMGLGLNQIFRYMFSGAGDAGFALANGIVEVVSRIAFALALTAIPFIGMWGLWLTNGMAWLLTCIFALMHYRSGKWKKKSLAEN